MTHLLDHITWHTLNGPHAQYAVGTDEARRYAPGFSPILGFADIERPNFGALADFCEAGEHFYTDGWSGVAPSGWRIDLESSMFKMVWEGGLPIEDPAPDAVRLGTKDAGKALELATLTNPGPFGIRTIELGDYFGFFDGEHLLAMAGERFCAGPWREVSGVCTRPDFEGRGLARRLMMKLIRLQMQRDERPFLHVMRDNAGARGLYEWMGFTIYRESVVRVVSLA